MVEPRYMHDACWAADPASDTVELVLQQDLTLFQILDCTGHLPLSYIRKEHWTARIQFLDIKEDIHWPSLLNDNDNLDNCDHKLIISTTSTVYECVEKIPILDHYLIQRMHDHKTLQHKLHLAN